MARFSIRFIAALWALSACCFFLTLSCSTPAKKTAGPPAAVNYYSDAEGAFTLKSPAAAIGSVLHLAGTSSFPELQIAARNTRSSGKGRQAIYRINGGRSFDFSYILKDGPGDYEVTLYGKRVAGSLELRGLCSFRVESSGNIQGASGIPDINGRILAFVKSVMGTTVGRGECWDLAQEALDTAGADWSRPFTFGTLLDPVKDRIRPGDIIQFRSVKIVEEMRGGGRRWEVLGAPDHTAIIIAVPGPGEYTLAHQNTGGKRSVITSSVNLNRMTSGTYWIYRPLAGIVR